MSCSVRRSLSLALFFCLILTILIFSPAKANAETPIKKVLCQTTSPYTPIVMLEVSGISCTTTTDNAVLTSWTWYDSQGRVDTDVFDNCSYQLDIRIDAMPGYYFPEGVEAYINSVPAVITRYNDGAYIVLSRMMDATVWAPSIIKNPGDETCDAGGVASFVSTAAYSSSCYWYMRSPDQKTYVYPGDIDKVFPGASLTGDCTEKIIIHNVTKAMDRYEVFCVFVAADGSEVTSKSAALHVNGADVTPAPTATPEPTPIPTPIPMPTPEPTPAPTPEPTPTPTPEPCKHNWTPAYDGNENFHWKACSICGERSEREAHNVEKWTVVKKATKSEGGQESGICTLCGSVVTRETAPAEGTLKSFGTLPLNLMFAGLFALALLGLIIELILTVRNNIRRRRRRRRRNK